MSYVVKQMSSDDGMICHRMNFKRTSRALAMNKIIYKLLLGGLTWQSIIFMYYMHRHVLYTMFLPKISQDANFHGDAAGDCEYKATVVSFAMFKHEVHVFEKPTRKKNK